MNPVEYGVTLCAAFEPSYIPSMIRIIKALKSILYARKPEDNSFTNNHTASKRHIIEYFKRLTEVQAVFDSKVKSSKLVLTNVCMSVKSINFVVRTLYSYISVVNKVNWKCSIYLKQILKFFEHRGVKGFEVRGDYFKPVDSKNSYTAKEFSKGHHYVLLQEASVEDNELEQPLSSFQSDLELLLEQVNVFPYNSYSNIEIPIKVLTKFLKQIMKDPSKYSLSPATVLDVQVLANKLFATIKEQRITNETLYNILSYYSQKALFFTELNDKSLFTLRTTMKNLESRLSYVKGRKKEFKNDVLLRTVAKMVIEEERMCFELCSSFPLDRFPSRSVIESNP